MMQHKSDRNFRNVVDQNNRPGSDNRIRRAKLLKYSVVYFDQQTGSLPAVRWLVEIKNFKLKQLFPSLMEQNKEKRKERDLDKP